MRLIALCIGEVIIVARRTESKRQDQLDPYAAAQVMHPIHHSYQRAPRERGLHGLTPHARAREKHCAQRGSRGVLRGDDAGLVKAEQQW